MACHHWRPEPYLAILSRLGFDALGRVNFYLYNTGSYAKQTGLTCICRVRLHVELLADKTGI
jgi:hypothetical protein